MMITSNKEEMLTLSDLLLERITQVLDCEGTDINGELSSKLSYAELNLYKISKLLKNDK